MARVYFYDSRRDVKMRENGVSYARLREMSMFD